MPTHLLNQLAYDDKYNPLVSAILIALDHADEFEMVIGNDAMQSVISLIPHWSNIADEGADRVNILATIDKLIADLIEVRGVVKFVLYDYQYVWEAIKCTCGAGFVPHYKHDKTCPWCYLVSSTMPKEE